jgi:hypothetical protein
MLGENRSIVGETDCGVRKAGHLPAFAPADLLWMVLEAEETNVVRDPARNIRKVLRRNASVRN